jgi:hypothetical protein
LKDEDRLTGKDITSINSAIKRIFGFKDLDKVLVFDYSRAILIYKLTENLKLKVGRFVNYSDTTGLKDYTGIVYSIWAFGRPYQSLTALTQLAMIRYQLPQMKKEPERASTWQKSKTILSNVKKNLPSLAKNPLTIVGGFSIFVKNK